MSNGTHPDAQASNLIPDSLRSEAKLWAHGQSNDSDFLAQVQLLVTQKIIVTAPVSSPVSKPIPVWIKSPVRWWSDGQISDSDFLNGLQWLVTQEILIPHAPTPTSPPSLAVQSGYHLVFFLQSTSDPSAYSANLDEFAKNLKPGDILFVSGSPKSDPPTVLQQTLAAKAAVGPGVRVYSLKFYFTIANITANAATLPKGFDYIGYDYEKGNNYSPEFATSEATSIGYFDQAQAAVKQYNVATRSNAKFMVTPPYGELKSANWDWGLAAKQMHTINMQMQSLILDPNYQELVTSVVSQIRQGSPNTELFVQVSLSRNSVQDNVNAINILKTLPIDGILVFYQNTQTSDLQQLFNSLNR